jgi:hypothetical protein
MSILYSILGLMVVTLFSVIVFPIIVVIFFWV